MKILRVFTALFLLALVPVTAFADPILQTAPCINNSALICATGIDGLEVVDTIFNVDFEVGSINSVYGSNDLPPQSPALSQAALLAICEVLRGTNEVEGVVGTGSPLGIWIPVFLIPNEGWTVLVLDFLLQNNPVACESTLFGIPDVSADRVIGEIPGGAFASFAVLEVVASIDIKPGSDPNSINLKSKGKIPVAILTTDAFLAFNEVDPLSVKFGPAEATEFHRASHVKDVDDDGDMDVLFHFDTSETGIACGDTQATLTGTTFGGQAISGTDSITTVHCP